MLHQMFLLGKTEKFAAKRFAAFSAFSCLLVIAACSKEVVKDDELTAMSNEEIEREVNYCNLIENPSRMKHMSCENFKRECDRRKKKNPRLAC